MAGDDGVSWAEVARSARERLTDAGRDQAALDVRILVEEVTGAEPGEYPSLLEQPATVLALTRFDRLLERRLAGEPLQYVIGHWAFRRLDLLVDRRVLIPRPETELVVEYALAEVTRLIGHHGHTYDRRLDRKSTRLNSSHT